MRQTVRKIFRSNKTCLVITGLLWLATIYVRFILAHESVPVPSLDWVIWIVCNNLIVAFFAYQLGVMSFTGKVIKAKRKSFLRGYLKGKAGHVLSGSPTVEDSRRSVRH